MTTTCENGSIVIVLSERFGYADASAYTSTVRQHLDSGNRRFVVDCSKLDFIDSTAIGALVNSLRSIESEEGNLVLRNLRGNALDLFEEASLDKLFTIQETTAPSPDNSRAGASQPKLSISREIHGDVVVLRLAGIITFPDGANLLKESLLPEIRQKRNLVLDLQGVFLIDSSSISDILSMNRSISTAGARLFLCNAQGYVNEVFDNLNLPRILRICKSLSEAVSAAKGS